MTLPLSGVTVLEFGVAIYGPLCARLLGDMGADVIKIEPLEGDWARLTGLRRGDSTVFVGCNRNKRSLAVNLKNPRGKEIAMQLDKQADIILQNFRPGVI